MSHYPKLLLWSYRALLQLTRGRGAHTLARLDAALFPTTRRVELENGVLMELSPDPHLFGYLIQVHEKHVRDWIDECVPAASNFVDVGANIGYFAGCAIARLRTDAMLILLEPDPDNFRSTAWLEPAAKARRIKLERLNGEASDQNGELFLRRHPEYCTYHSVSSITPSAAEEASTLRVPAVNLSNFLAARGIESVDCLKIDVEGHEDAVLCGAAALFNDGRVRHAMIEVTPGPGADIAFKLGCAGGYAKQYWLNHRWNAWTDAKQICQRLDVRLDIAPTTNQPLTVV